MNINLKITSQKRRRLAILYLLLWVSNTILAQKIPDKAIVLSNMKLANAYFMQKWPDPVKPTVTNKVRPSNLWTRAVFYEGLMELYKMTHDSTLLNYAIEWGEGHKWELQYGRNSRHADPMCAGQTYLDLFIMQPEPIRKEAAKQAVDAMVFSEKSSDWTWIDALQMAMPVFAKLAVIEKDNRYAERMYDLYNHSKTIEGGGLYNSKEHLWWRDKDFVPPYKTPTGKNCYWSRGNGWVVAALVRVMDILPKDAPHYKEYEKTYLEMMEALVPLQREDGLWNVSLTDETHYGGKELTGSALFAYGMAWGMNKGLLSKKKFLKPTLKVWKALVNDCLHTNGKLGYVQGTGKEPKDGQPVTYDSTPDFEDYGLGCFLLAGSEVYKLKK